MEMDLNGIFIIASLVFSIYFAHYIYSYSKLMGVDLICVFAWPDEITKPQVQPIQTVFLVSTNLIICCASFILLHIKNFRI